jgi:hypothetical protein
MVWTVNNPAEMMEVRVKDGKRAWSEALSSFDRPCDGGLTPS